MSQYVYNTQTYIDNKSTNAVDEVNTVQIRDGR